MIDEELARLFIIDKYDLRKDLGILAIKTNWELCGEYNAYLAGLRTALDIKDSSDKKIEPILCKLKDLGIIKTWYYNGTYHAC